MWLAEVTAKAKRKNQILFSRDSLLLAELSRQIRGTNRRALILWALDLAGETVEMLEARYPADPRPREAVEAARSWAKGDIKMPVAKQAILNCHAMAKDLTSPADAARCHAVAQGCSVVHTSGHALGYPIYELTAIVLEQGLETCREAMEARAAYYLERLLHWQEREPRHSGPWANFIY